MRILVCFFLMLTNLIALGQLFGDGRCGYYKYIDLKRSVYWSHDRNLYSYGYLDSIGPNKYYMRPKYDRFNLPVSCTTRHGSNKDQTKLFFSITGEAQSLINHFYEESIAVINDSIKLVISRDTTIFRGFVHTIYIEDTIENIKTAELQFDRQFNEMQINFELIWYYYWYNPEDCDTLSLRKNKLYITHPYGRYKLKRLNKAKADKILRTSIFNSGLDWVLRFNFELECENEEMIKLD